MYFLCPRGPKDFTFCSAAIFLIRSNILNPALLYPLIGEFIDRFFKELLFLPKLAGLAYPPIGKPDPPSLTCLPVIGSPLPLNFFVFQRFHQFPASQRSLPASASRLIHLQALPSVSRFSAYPRYPLLNSFVFQRFPQFPASQRVPRHPLPDLFSPDPSVL
jgi:hypothetical protein